MTPRSALTSDELAIRAANPQLVGIGSAWTEKVLNGGGPGWLVTHGIRESVAKSPFNKSDLGRALSAATVAQELQRQAEITLQIFVDEARDAGASWADISDQLHMSRQTAFNRFRHGVTSGKKS